MIETRDGRPGSACSVRATAAQPRVPRHATPRPGCPSHPGNGNNKAPCPVPRTRHDNPGLAGPHGFRTHPSRTRREDKAQPGPAWPSPRQPRLVYLIHNFPPRPSSDRAVGRSVAKTAPSHPPSHPPRYTVAELEARPWPGARRRPPAPACGTITEVMAVVNWGSRAARRGAA